MTNFERLDELTKDGLLRKVVSDCGRLVLYNYTDHCTYERKWNKDTLNARGTVYELSTGRVVARAFPKFFNFGELAVSKQRNLLKQTDFQAFEKLDGSLGIIYFYDGKWRINTRGSFSSEQAIEGQKMLDSGKYKTEHLNTGWTYLVEIIYPENKIIVDYGKNRELVMLAILVTESSTEVSPEQVREISNILGFRYAEPCHFDNIDQVIQEQETLGMFEEGYVLLFKSGERVKFKSKEYLKLAAAMSHMTPLHFWKHMKDGGFDIEFLRQFPEEVIEEAGSIATQLVKEYNAVMSEVVRELNNICPVIRSKKEVLCKHIGQNIKSFKHSGGMFALINEQQDRLDSYILKTIRPKGNNFANYR